MKINSSSTGRTAKFLMYQVQRMLKAKQLSSGRNTEEPTRDGKLSILMKLKSHKKRDFMVNSDSTSTDHSTLFQDFQCTEFSKLLEPTMSVSRDILRAELHNNSFSMESPRLLEATTGRTTLWKSNPTEVQPMSE